MLLINDLSKKLAKNDVIINEAIERVISSGWLVLGPEVKRFEREFAAFHSVAHCVSVANGTDAIELGLKAIGVTKESRVVTVANAGFYTSTALCSIGATPIFIDVDAATQNVTLQAIREALELRSERSRIDAVVVTHLFGLAVPEIKQIAALCKSHNIPLLEDCAQAHGAKIDGQRVGSFGDVACFSFYPTKNLGALGDGGAVVSDNEQTAELVRVLRQYGWGNKYEVDAQGGRNSRLDELQAAVLLNFLPELDIWNEQRRSITKRYNEEINQRQLVLPQHEGDSYVAHLYVTQCHQRDNFRAHLAQDQIATDIHYPVPDHRQKVLKEYEVAGSLAVTEQVCHTSVTLPCYPDMSEDQVTKVIESVNRWHG